jgi:hypothetical protein
MQIANNLLVDELTTITDRCTEAVKLLSKLDTAVLNRRKDEGSWSVLECIEHLNLYGDFYLPEIEKQLLEQRPEKGRLVFKSGIIGNYFANLMQVKEGKQKKMKSPKDKNPVHRELTITSIDRFLKQQHKLKDLLDRSRHINLTRTRTAISLTPLIKLRMGDTFRFLVYHIERHVQQAARAAV